MVSLAATLGNGDYAKTGGWEDERDDFAAAISVAGAYDLTRLDWSSAWLPPGVDWQTAREYASPLTHVSAQSRPLLVIHSDDDRSVRVEQAVDMGEALAKSSSVHEFVHYTDRGHMRMTEEVVDAALQFIKKVQAGGA